MTSFLISAEQVILWSRPALRQTRVIETQRFTLHVSQYLPNDHQVFDASDDFQSAATDTTRFDVDIEHTLQALLPAHQILRHMLNLAANDWIDNGKTWIAHAPRIRLLPRNPGKHADQSKGEAHGYPLPREKQMPFFRQLPMHQYHVAWFILMTGCREHEVLPVRDKDSTQLVGGLKWCHEVKLPNGLFVFDLPTSKNAQPKRIFLNSLAREIVDSCRGDHPEYVFAHKGRRDDGPGGPFQKVNNTACKRARKAAGLENVRGPGQHFRVHDLRHTTGARLREDGVSREDRKDILGHANDDIRHIIRLRKPPTWWTW